MTGVEETPALLSSHFSDLQIFQGQCRHRLGMVEEISHSHNLVEEVGDWLRSEGSLIGDLIEFKGTPSWVPDSKDPSPPLGDLSQEKKSCLTHHSIT